MKTTIESDLGRNCPDAESLAALIDGGVGSEERARLTTHIAECDRCYDTVTETAHFLSEDISAPPRAARAPTLFPSLGAMPSAAALILVVGSLVVFSLLSRGQRSFQREPEIAHLQQSARMVLDMVSRDVVQAGAGLPPEFPAFSRINGAGDATPTDVIEMIGTFRIAGEPYLDPEDVTGFIANHARMRANTSNFEVGHMVIVYNDTTTDPAITPTPPQWALARVINVVENAADPAFQAQVTLDYDVFDPQYSHYLDGAGADITNANFLSSDGRLSKMTRVSVVRYFTVLDNPAEYSGPPPRVLMRDVDFAGIPQAVGYLEDFQIAYTIGATAPVDQDNPPDPAVDRAGASSTADNMVSRVRISVTARSVTAGMQGASEGGAGLSDDFIRKTFSTNVNPRSVTAAYVERHLKRKMKSPQLR